MEKREEAGDGQRSVGPLTQQEAEQEFVRVMRRWREKREERQQQEDGGDRD